MALWKMVAALAFTITMSATMIIFNAMLLQGFRHPVWLTFWHQSVSTCCVLLVRCAKPSLVTITSDENHEPLGVLGALWLGAPIACMQSVGLICGNTAVMYLSVGFCQMIKAWTASAVYVVGCFVGTQVWYRAVAKTLVIITSGLMITSIGELKFDAYGFLMQVLALFAEAFRINLVETRLKSAGYKLNPLSSVLATAPVASLLLLLIGLIFDRDALNAQALEAIGWPKLVANGLVAFFLNVAIFLAISVCSGLVYSLAGIVKDISIILGSVLIMGSSVSSLQVVGYSVAIGGIQTYGLVSKEPAKFDSAGLCIGLWQHLSLMTSPGTLLAVAPQSIGVDEQQWEKKKEVELEDLEAGDAHREPDSGSASRSACSEKRLLDAATDSSGSADSSRRHVNSEGNNGDGL